MALDQLYQQLLLAHNRSPRNFGPLAGATHAGPGYDALCGDDIQVELKIEQGRILAAAFSGEACAVTKASASMMTEWLPGRTVEELPLWLERLAELLARPDLPDLPELGQINQLRAVSAFPARVRNALLPWRAAVSAVATGEVLG